MAVSLKYGGTARGLGFALAEVLSAYLRATPKERREAMERALHSIPGTGMGTTAALQLIRDWNGDATIAPQSVEGA